MADDYVVHQFHCDFRHEENKMAQEVMRDAKGAFIER